MSKSLFNITLKIKNIYLLSRTETKISTYKEVKKIKEVKTNLNFNSHELLKICTKLHIPLIKLCKINTNIGFKEISKIHELISSLPIIFDINKNDYSNYSTLITDNLEYIYTRAYHLHKTLIHNLNQRNVEYNNFYFNEEIFISVLNSIEYNKNLKNLSDITDKIIFKEIINNFRRLNRG